MKRPAVIDLAVKGLLAQFKSIPAQLDLTRAVCMNADSEVFFSEDPSEIALAKSICGECPIARQCAEWAAKNAEYGVFGGLTPEERQQKFGLSIIDTELSPDEILRQENFILNQPASKVAEFFGVDTRTVMRWRRLLNSYTLAA
jgi:WhiB family redox-sensing transcriptional regulator